MIMKAICMFSIPEHRGVFLSLWQAHMNGAYLQAALTQSSGTLEPGNGFGFVGTLLT
jgi:hypothetical protein